MKRFVCLLTLLLVAQCVFAELWPGSEGWEVDGEYGFNVAFIDQTQVDLKNKNLEKVVPFNFVEESLPDISNIRLEDLLKMGFTPNYSGETKGMNLFIKLYRFPKSFSHLKIIGKIPGKFRFDLPLGGAELSTYMASRSRIFFKKCFIANSNTKFSEQNPFPGMYVEKNNPIFQNEFGKSIFFYSLYLKPSLDPSKGDSNNARMSAGGVIAFHRALLSAYKKELVEVTGPDKDCYYFIGSSSIAKGNMPAKVNILKLPAKPMVFDNWKDLPMPHKPGNKFLSSLLLLTSTEYSSKTKNPETLTKITGKEFESGWNKGRTLIFEFGSIFSED